MPLTKEKRTELVDGLVTNCDCWNEGDKEVLNSFDDAKLKMLTENLTRTDTNESRSSSTTSMNLGEVSDADIEKEVKNRNRRMERNSAENAEGETTTTENTKPVTAQDWLKAAPPEIQNTFKYAQQIEIGEKDKIIAKLTANIQGADKRIHQERLRKRPLDDLRNDLTLLPTVEETTPTTNEDTGGSSYLSSLLNRVNQESDEGDPLMVPTINWGESEESVTAAVENGYNSMENPNPGNDAEWLRNAPSNVRSMLQNAVKIQEGERNKLINHIVKNVEGEDKLRLIDRLSHKSLEELAELTVLSGGEVSTTANYAGAAGTPPVTNQSLDEEDKNDILMLPTMDYGEQKQA